MSIHDGTVVANLIKQRNQSASHAHVRLSPKSWPAGTVLRVFASDDNGEWYPVSAGLEVEAS